MSAQVDETAEWQVSIRHFAKRVAHIPSETLVQDLVKARFWLRVFRGGYPVRHAAIRQMITLARRELRRRGVET